MFKQKQKAFTLLELLVAIAIIGIVATLAVISLQQARGRARDSKRINDIQQVHMALEFFFNENGRYPSEEEWSSGSINSPLSGEPYIQPVPSAPTPADGDCSLDSNFYAYNSQKNNTEYRLYFCLGGPTSNLSAGEKVLTPEGILDVVDCASHVSEPECKYNNYIYKVVQINNQNWFAENLRTTKYNNGQNIPVLQDSVDWSGVGASSGPASSWVVVGDEVIYDYGLLYNWHAVSNNNQFNLCPAGWRVPSYEDAENLHNFLGEDIHKIKSCCQENVSPEVLNTCLNPVGGCSRSKHPRWDVHVSRYGTNEYRASILPAGVRWAGGEYNNVGSLARFWTTTFSNDEVYNFSVWDVFNDIYIRSDGLRNGYSVRCIKDLE